MLFPGKLLFIAALLVFEVGSVVIGSAQTIEATVIGRAIAGVGSAGIYVGSMNIMSAMTVPSERNQYLTLVGVSWSLGTILGPIVGGAFADSGATWRWAFYINPCIAAFAAPACILLIPSIHPPAASRPFWERVRRIDFVGAVLFLGGALCIIMILSFGGAVYEWSSAKREY